MILGLNFIIHNPLQAQGKRIPALKLEPKIPLPQLLGGFENMKNSSWKGGWRRGKQPLYESCGINKSSCIPWNPLN